MPPSPSESAFYAEREIQVRADAVQCGDYLAGLGRVQSFTHGGNSNARRVTLSSEGNDWKVNIHPMHPVVVIRRHVA